MHPVFAPSGYSSAARYYKRPAACRVDGSPPPRGDHTPVDNRDQDAVWRSRPLPARPGEDGKGEPPGPLPSDSEAYYLQGGHPASLHADGARDRRSDKRGMLLRGLRRKSKTSESCIRAPAGSHRGVWSRAAIRLRRFPSSAS